MRGGVIVIGPLFSFKAFFVLVGKVRRCLVLKLLSLQFVTLLKEPEHSPKGNTVFIPHASICIAPHDDHFRPVSIYSFMTSSNRN